MKLIITIIVLVTIVFILMMFGFDSLSWREEHTNYYCDVGENETLGDFKANPDNWVNNRQCSIKDCAIFNKLQKQKESKMRCVI